MIEVGYVPQVTCEAPSSLSSGESWVARGGAKWGMVDSLASKLPQRKGFPFFAAVAPLEKVRGLQPGAGRIENAGPWGEAVHFSCGSGFLWELARKRRGTMTQRLRLPASSHRNPGSGPAEMGLRPFPPYEQQHEHGC